MIYTLLVSTSLKFHSVLLYDQPSPRYNFAKNGNAQHGPRLSTSLLSASNDLKRHWTLQGEGLNICDYLVGYPVSFENF